MLWIYRSPKLCEYGLILSNNKGLDWPNLNQNIWGSVDHLIGWKTLWEKEKMLVTSIFSFFLNVFKRLPFGGFLTLYHTIPTFNDSGKETFWKHCGKRRKCWLPAFSPFPTCFLSFQKRILIFESHFFCRLQMLSIWTSLKFCCLVKS